MWDDARQVDLFYGIDAHTKKVRYVINNDGLRHMEGCAVVNIIP